MISKQAQDFWTLLKSYPKQIEMPLAQAREAIFTPKISRANRKASPFRPHPKLMVSGLNLPIHMCLPRSRRCHQLDRRLGARAHREEVA